MDNQICLDKRFSTTRRLFRETPGSKPGFDVTKKDSDKGSHGGLRLKGYFKYSSYDCPVVTVIIIASGDAEKLEKTLRSVSDQTHDNVELIVIGASDADPVIGIIKNWDDKIDYWMIEPGIGNFDAMNKGADFASGDWVNFQYSGDAFYEKNTIQTVLAAEFERADFIFGHTYYNSGDFVGVQKARDFNILWKRMTFTIQSLFSKRTALKKRKFNSKIKFCADYELVVDFFMKGFNFFNSDTVITSFDPGHTETHCARMVFEKWKIIKKYRSDFEFHQYYFRLFFKRLFQGMGKKVILSKKQ
jgi:glycosyltransferase involved in cell wall biosynthesis